MTDKTTDRLAKEDRRQVEEYAGDEINLSEYFAVFRRIWWKVFLLSIGVGLISLLVTFIMPNIFQATAVITPATEEGKQVPSLGLGPLASFGITIGGSTKVEDLETLFKSNDLTVRVFKKYNLWPIVFMGRFDSSTGKLKPDLADRIFRSENELRAPGDWDSIRAAKDLMKVSVNKKNGTLALSFESRSAEASADIVRYYLDEGKSRLQEEAIERASRNKKFIEEQIARTMDPLTRDRLYSLYGQEVEREMLARNREQFGFRVIDHPRVPDRKYRPRRSLTAILAAFLSFFSGCVFFALRGNTRRNEYPQVDANTGGINR